MDNTNKFTGKAKVYADSRPGYPKEFIEYLKTSAGLRGGSVAADIGSGDGQAFRRAAQSLRQGRMRRAPTTICGLRRNAL